MIVEYAVEREVTSKMWHRSGAREFAKAVMHQQLGDELIAQGLEPLVDALPEWTLLRRWRDETGAYRSDPVLTMPVLPVPEERYVLRLAVRTQAVPAGVDARPLPV